MLPVSDKISKQVLSFVISLLKCLVIKKNHAPVLRQFNFDHASKCTRSYAQLDLLKGSPRNKVQCSADQPEWFRQRKSTHAGLWLGIVAFETAL